MSYTIAILAAQRTGIINPIAEAYGVSHKCLAPICGRPLISWVIDAVAQSRASLVRVAIEADGEAGVEPLLKPLRDKGIPVEFIRSALTLTDSVHACADGIDGPMILTTADNVNLSVEAIEQAAAALADGAEVIFSLASREAVLAARGEVAGPHTANVGPYKFRDGRFSNCNLYAFSGPKAVEAAGAFREGGQFSKQRGRLIRAVGLFNVALYLAGFMTLAGAAKRLSKRFGFKIVPVVFADGAQAIDVDNERTYKISEQILLRRLG